jgi:ParB family transcriptional regulator, chromosome partitioning protein
MTKQKALGRGISALLSEVTEVYDNEVPQENVILEIDLKSIRANPFQPRKHFDDASLQELGESIKNDGLLQPVVVTEDIDGYILISGERRVRASKLMKLKTIKAIVIKVDEPQMRQLSLIENIQRDQLNAIELAQAYNELIKLHEITHDELATMIHKSRAHITNSMRLLQLSKKTQKALVDKKITAGHARVLVGLDEKEQHLMVSSIVGQKLSVRDVENMIKSMKQQDVKIHKNQQEDEKKLDFSDLQEQLKKIGITSSVKSDNVSIKFSDQVQIDNFVAKLLKL